MNKKVILTISALTLLAGAGLVSQNVYAEENQGEFPPMIQALVDKFNLNSDEVSQVLEEQHQLRHQEMQANMEAKLDEAVANGTLTQTQKEAWLAKMAEHETDMDNLTPEERREEGKTHRDEMQAWADENGIDLSILDFGRGEGEKGHDGHGMW